MEDTKEILLFLWSQRKRMLMIIIPCVVLGLLVSLLLQPKFKAATSIMPLDPSQTGGGSILGVLDSMPGFGSLVSKLGGGRSGDKLMNTLMSRTVALAVLNKLDLLKKFNASQWNEATGAWKNPQSPPSVEQALEKLQFGIMEFVESDRGLITITSTYTDQELVAAIANAYVDELQHFLNDHSFSVGTRNRKFVETQLENVQRTMKLAQDELLAFQKQYNIISMEAQSYMTTQTIANLKEQLISNEIQLGSLRLGSAPNSPGIQQLERQNSEIRKQLSILYGNYDNKKSAKNNAGDGVSTNPIFTSTKDAPDLQMRFAELTRDMMLQSKLFELLNQQYELAKINESRDALSFEVIDEAVRPEFKDWPNRKLIILITGFLATLGAAVYVTMRRNYLGKRA